MYKAIYCCATCKRIIEPPVNFKGLDKHRAFYKCESTDWLVFNNLEYLEYLYSNKTTNV